MHNIILIDICWSVQILWLQQDLSPAEEDDVKESNYAKRKGSRRCAVDSRPQQTGMGIKRFKCSLCTLSFAIPRVLETHKMIEHQLEPRWKCRKCSMPFLHGMTYNAHMASSHNVEQPHICDVCDQVFATTSDLKIHRRVHVVSIKNQIYKCEFCPAEFPHLCKLKYHRRRHTGEKPFKCSLCDLAFATSSQRLNHINRFHHMIRKHLCDHCGKKFSGPRELREHYRTHTGERPFKCPVCSRAFAKSNAMNVHLRQHTGEKPYVCDKCGQAFTVRVSLRTHLKNKHNIIDNGNIQPSGSVPLGTSNDGIVSTAFASKIQPANRDSQEGASVQKTDVAWRQRGRARKACPPDRQSTTDEHQEGQLVTGLINEWVAVHPAHLANAGLGHHPYKTSQLQPLTSHDPLSEPSSLRYHDSRDVTYWLPSNFPYLFLPPPLPPQTTDCLQIKCIMCGWCVFI